MKRIAALVLTASLAVATASATPANTGDSLVAEIMAMDELLFGRGFNRCDLSVYESILADDLEFYHDLGGLTSGRVAFTEDFRKGICASPYKPRREIVSESVKVYPLANQGAIYGAIETGAHRFYETPPGQAERQTGEAQFTLLWLKDGERWKLKRALSFDHRAANEAK